MFITLDNFVICYSALMVCVAVETYDNRYWTLLDWKCLLWYGHLYCQCCSVPTRLHSYLLCTGTSWCGLVPQGVVSLWISVWRPFFSSLFSCLWAGYSHWNCRQYHIFFYFSVNFCLIYFCISCYIFYCFTHLVPVNMIYFWTAPVLTSRHVLLS